MWATWHGTENHTLVLWKRSKDSKPLNHLSNLPKFLIWIEHPYIMLQGLLTSSCLSVHGIQKHELGKFNEPAEAKAAMSSMRVTTEGSGLHMLNTYSIAMCDL